MRVQSSICRGFSAILVLLLPGEFLSKMTQFQKSMMQKTCSASLLLHQAQPIFHARQEGFYSCAFNNKARKIFDEPNNHIICQFVSYFMVLHNDEVNEPSISGRWGLPSRFKNLARNIRGISLFSYRQMPLLLRNK